MRDLLSWPGLFPLNRHEGSETICAGRTMMKTKLLLATFLLSAALPPTFSAPQQKSESASKILALEDKLYLIGCQNKLSA